MPVPDCICRFAGENRAVVERNTGFVICGRGRDICLILSRSNLVGLIDALDVCDFQTRR
jgi:hypothetical protein